MKKFTLEEIKFAQNQLNERPRKFLDWGGFYLALRVKKTLSLAEPIIVSRSPHPDRFEYRCGLNNIALPHFSTTKEAFLKGLTAILRSEFDQS